MISGLLNLKWKVPNRDAYVCVSTLSTLAVPTLTVNGDSVPFGSRFTLSNVTFRFLSRGSITLTTNQPNTFPLRLGSGLYNCYAPYYCLHQTDNL